MYVIGKLEESLMGYTVVPSKTQMFLAYVGGMGVYGQVCDSIAAADYKGFTFNEAKSTRV